MIPARLPRTSAFDDRLRYQIMHDHLDLVLTAVLLTDY